MRTVIFVIFFLFFQRILYSLEIDSLKQTLENTSDPKVQAEILNTLSGEYRYKDIKTSYNYAIKALELANKHNYREAKAYAFNRIGFYFHSIGQPDSALGYFSKSLNIYKSENNKEQIANTYNLFGIAYKNIDILKSREYYHKGLLIQKKYKLDDQTGATLSNIGVTYMLTDDYDTALIYFSEALHYDSLSTDTVNIAITLNIIGGVYFQKGMYLKSIEYSIAALTIFERFSKEGAVSKTLNNIGDIYFAQKEYKKALEYYEKSLKIKNTLEDKTGYANTLGQIAIIKFNQNINTEALEHINKCVEIYKSTNDKWGLSIAYRLIGQIYFKLNKLDKSLDMFVKSVKISSGLNEKYGIAESYSYMGMVYRKKGNNEKSVTFLNDAFKISKEIGALELQRSILKELADAYKDTEQYLKAINSLLLYITLNDSILNIENKKVALEIEAKYEISKKEMELAITLKDKIINELTIKQQETELKKQRIFRNALISASIFAMLILLIVFNKGIQRISIKNK